MNFRDILGAFLIVGFVFATGVLFWKAIPPANEQLIAYMLGQLSGFVAGVVGFHYITKAGEKELEQKRADNTGEALRAIAAAAHSTPLGDDAARAADEVADAAVEAADEITKETRHDPPS